MHTHGCRYDWGTDLAIALRYRSDCVTVCSLGLYSNISWVAMLSTIVVGGTIVVLPAFSAASLVDAIERHGVTHGGFVPVQFQRVLELPGIATRNLSSLQAIMCCGSPLPPPLKRATRDTLACELIELYGLTEGIITTLAPEDFDAHSNPSASRFRASSSSSCATTTSRRHRASSAKSAGTDGW